MNKFIFAVEDSLGKLHFGVIKAWHGTDAKAMLEKRYPNANGMNFFGYTGDERTEDVTIHLPTKVVNRTYTGVSLEDKPGKLTTTATFDPPVTIGMGERLTIKGNTYTLRRVSDDVIVATGRIIDAGSFLPSAG